MPIVSFLFIEIFILLSIKTRIETSLPFFSALWGGGFLSYYPLKQGLKRVNGRNPLLAAPLFLSYYPLKQGLKHIITITHFLFFWNFYPTIH